MTAPQQSSKTDVQTHADPHAASASPAGGTVLRSSGATHDLADLLRRVVETARGMVGADAAAILLYDGPTDMFVPAVPSVAVGLDERWLQRQGLEAAQTMARRAVEAYEVVEILDTAEAPDLDLPLLRGRRPPGAACVVPLELDGAAVGAVAVYDAAPRAAPYEREGLRPFAALVSLAITQAQAHEREQALRVRLETLDAASKALAAELALDRILQRLVTIATQLVGARYGALGVIGGDGYLTNFITTGLSAEERERIGALPRGHGLLGALIRQGLPLRVPAIHRDPRRVGFPPYHPPMTSLLGVPIKVRQALVGSLYLTEKAGALEFTEDDQHLIELLAAHAGVAVENARLYAQVEELSVLRERERIGRDLHDGIIQEIYAGTLRLESLAEELSDEGQREQLQAATAHFSSVIGDVRAYIHGLGIPELQGRLLSAGLVALVQEVNGRASLRAACAVEGEPYALPETLGTTLVQIAREALSNVVKYAGATQAHVAPAYAAQHVTLTVTDDGRGFDVGVAMGEDHRGLRNMRTRAQDAAGAFSVMSAPGAGTTIRVIVPRPA